MYSGYAMPQVKFVAEQDGAPERELKTRLIPRLKKSSSVISAFLLRVQYGESLEERVALGVEAEGTHQGELVEVIGEEFRKLFKKSEALDILFLTREQQAEATAVAHPFYERAGHKARQGKH